jgi:hypothetical protein
MGRNVLEEYEYRVSELAEKHNAPLSMAKAKLSGAEDGDFAVFSLR